MKPSTAAVSAALCLTLAGCGVSVDPQSRAGQAVEAPSSVPSTSASPPPIETTAPSTDESETSTPPPPVEEETSAPVSDPAPETEAEVDDRSESSPSPEAETESPAPETSAEAEPPAADESRAAGEPGSVSIPSIGAYSSLVSLGLDERNRHEVPPVSQPQQAGWYEPGPEPGQVGPAIILGHVNGGGEPGVFVDLHNVQPGDEVIVDDFTFVVTEVESADKDAFPAERVYSETDKPELRVITCGGAFDQGVGSYENNIIVYADLQ